MNLSEAGIESLAVYGGGGRKDRYYLDGHEITKAEYDRIVDALKQIDEATQELRKVVGAIKAQPVEEE